MRLTKLRRTTTIYAPTEKIFEFIDDAEMLGKYGVGISRVKEVSRTKDRIGDILTLTYTVLGQRCDLQFTYNEYRRPRSLGSKVTGQMSGSCRVELEQEGTNQTLVTLEAEYEIVSGALVRALNKLLLERVNEKNLERTLGNIKAMVETGWFGEAASARNKTQESVAASQSAPASH
jgi:carbon monoxide dehydrogenase subunit G